MSSFESTAAQILLEAVEHDPGVRPAFVQKACAGDPILLNRVEALLRAHGQANPLLDGERLVATLDLPPQEKLGTLIGPYKLRELLAEGGMGSVFVAEQEQPVRRKVALKVIKPGMDSRQVLGRFEAERQALELMDHPHIAKVLDAGMTDSGHPYFVMELVRGIPITEFCDQRRLDPRQRLGLFIQVCRAIQHAHQKGIIHRDIKPSNILVTLHDNLAVPIVIDFGIAKATGLRMTDQSVYTGFNQLIGTPLYMSPEQAELNALDVDARSDVYSLGVLLYELLTGSTPFDNETFRQAGFDEMRRLIREVDPPCPSHRVSTLHAQAASTVSQSRGVDERRLHRALRGDLDWIVMKALEKDRNRRYESASALAVDVQRHLDGEPIQARPPQMFAGARRWCRRHRTVTSAAAVAAILLLMFGAAVAADRHRVWREATNFVQLSFDAAREALASGDVNRSLIRLSEAQARIDASDVANPALIEKVAAFHHEATRYEKFVLLCEMGRQHQYATEPWISDVNEALALYDVMNNSSWLAGLRKSALPESHVTRVSDRVYEMLLQRADDLIRWEDKLPEQGRGQQLDEQCRQALDCLEKAASFHTPSRGYYWLLANCAQIQHEPDREMDLRKTALATPPHSAAELFYMNRDHNWGSVSTYQGHPEYPFEQNYKDHREMLRFDPRYFNGLHYMGLRLYGEGRYQESLVAWYGCLALRPDDFFSLLFRSRTHRQLKQYDEALFDANTVIDKFPDIVDGWTLRGHCYASLKQFDRAIQDFDKAIEVEKSIGGYGLEHPLQALAWVLSTAPDEQVRDGKRAVGLAIKACDLTQNQIAEMVDTLAAAYAETGNFELAVSSSEKALKLATDQIPRTELQQTPRTELQQHLEGFRQQKPWRQE